ncbi:Glucose / Sorbosone dehydrogenase [Amycolatopsis marina]|uniref:Glucose / Sorbosone dehydrogenase n=1 Tax=Amycolatopsis marina TaxID=490629 RepID=A0A1I0YHK2_9PSEU|nr:PQQ-dependent sugar dehydrogenase [Amycolatopsis marina]SFB12691.1 Glucose / Sorbosone dehydrogenase [Amycolatopsis marina]
MLTSCADFDDSASGQTWEPAPDLTPQAGPQPQLPEAGGTSQGPPKGSAPTPVPPPDGCKDFNKAVIATCLDRISAVAALPAAGSTIGALAAERISGSVLRVSSEPGASPKEIASFDVDASGDGGLTGLALSPSYSEDRLVFAYLTTEKDNRVVRFAEGQPPKPVLTGIPKGPKGNRGVLLADSDGALLVATGDAGDPAAAADPKSLAGKMLRIDTSGKPAKGNPTTGSRVLASGLQAPGGICESTDGSRTWVTDRADGRDVMYRVEPGTTLTTPVWSWPDQPGVAGCTDWSDVLIVATSKAGNLQNLPVTEEGAVSGKPSVTMDGENGNSFGRLTGMDVVNPDFVVAGTANKDGGDPVSSDDRVVLISRQMTPAGNGRD